MPNLRMPAGTLAVEALVFDKDGVLIDFEKYWGAMTRNRIIHLGFDPLQDADETRDLRALLGYPADKVDPDGPLVLATRLESATLAAGYLYQHGLKWVDAQEFVRGAWSRSLAEMPPNALSPCEGVGEALARLAAAGFRLGVATTDSHDHAVACLRRVGIADRFVAVIGGDEVARGKPHPEMLLELCERLRTSPARTAVVGDGVNDLRMGKAAGCCATIGVLSGVSHQEHLVAEADVILAGVKDLPALIEPVI